MKGLHTDTVRQASPVNIGFHMYSPLSKKENV